MKRKLTILAERRRQLVAQAAAQRSLIARTAAPWRARLAWADRGIAAVRSLRRHPAMMVGAALLLAALRPQRAGKWLHRGWLAWMIGRRLRAR